MNVVIDNTLNITSCNAVASTAAMIVLSTVLLKALLSQHVLGLPFALTTCLTVRGCVSKCFCTCRKLMTMRMRL